MDEVIESPQPPTRDALYVLPDILARGKFSKSHIYNLMARGQFPQPVIRMGPRFTRWASASVDSWFSDPSAWIKANAKDAYVAA